MASASGRLRSRLPNPEVEGRLLRRSVLRLGEGPKGYLARLAEGNGLGSGRLERLGIVFDCPSLRRSGCLGGSENQALVRYVGRVSSALRRYPEAWLIGIRRFCPVCLREAEYWRFEWELRFVEVCVEHGVWLVSRCDDCHTTLHWEQRSLLHCSCRRRLTNSGAAAAPDALRWLGQSLRSKILGPSTDAIPAWFNRLDLADASRAIHFLGSYLGGADGRMPQKVMRQLANANSWARTSVAAELLSSWPNGLRSALSGLVSNARTRDRRLSTHFGHFYRHLFRQFAGQQFDPIRNAFQDWLRDEWIAPLARRNRRTPQRVLEQASRVSLKTAINLSGTPASVLRRAINDGILDADTRTGKDGRLLYSIKRAAIVEFSQQLPETWDLTAAAKALGLSRRRARQIIPHLMPGSLPSSPGSGKWQIPVQSLLSIQRKIESVPERVRVSRELVTLGALLRSRDLSDSTIAGLVKGWVDGISSAVSREPGAPGLQGLVFARSVLQEHVRAGNPSISIPDLARALNVKQEVAYYLVRFGWISRAQDASEKTARVSGEAIEAFRRDYVAAAELALKFGTSPKKVIEVLADSKVAPIAGFGKGGIRQAFFRRSDINFADPLLKALLARQGRRSARTSLTGLARYSETAISK